MKRIHWYKAAAVLLLIGGLMAACEEKGDGPETTSPAEQTTAPAPEEKTISVGEDYRIVRKDFGNTGDAHVQAAITLKRYIQQEIGLTIPMATDWQKPGEEIPEKEILIGENDRPESREIYDSLGKNEWCVAVIEKKIIIAGSTAPALNHALEYFMENYVSGKKEISVPGDLYRKDYFSNVLSTITLENGVKIDIELISTVFQVPKNNYTEEFGYPTNVRTAHYPSIIELQHSGENNGRLIGIFCLGDTPRSGLPNTQACVMESTDDGETWKMISRPSETIDPSIKGISMAHIYELPAQVGDMPAGTLLYSGNSVDYSRKSHIAVWRSFDCGRTWEEYTIIAEGGGSKEGVWEPFVWYEESDGYLYCFYSDDSDPAHDQKLVYKRSKDGVNWSELYDVCTFPRQSDRPGMFIMTKMGTDSYFMVYEYFGAEHGAVHYKITDDITSWDPTSPGTKLQISEPAYSLSGAPSCIWTPAGGEKGTLIASGKHVMNGEGGSPRLFVSCDQGATWETIDNFLPYDPNNDVRNTNRIGHSPSFFVGADPSVIYYMNCTDTPETGRQRIQFARVRIHE